MCIYVSLSLSLYICIYIYMCVYMCVYIYIYTYLSLSLSLYMYIHIRNVPPPAAETFKAKLGGAKKGRDLRGVIIIMIIMIII